MKRKRSDSSSSKIKHLYCYLHNSSNTRSVLLIFLIMRRLLHGFSPSTIRLRRPGIVVTSSQRFFSDRSRLSKWDDIFFESSSSNNEKKTRTIPPNRDFMVNDDEERLDGYHPIENAFNDTESLPSEINSKNHTETDGSKEARISFVRPKASNFHTTPHRENTGVGTKNTDVEELVPVPKVPKFKRVELMIPAGRENLYTRTKDDNNDNVESPDDNNNNVESPDTENLDQRRKRLDMLEERIFNEHNNGKEFNINSPKQVSELLFGTSNQSSNRDALEALTTCNNKQLASLADLILQYRRERQTIQRLIKKENTLQTGKYITSFSKNNSASQPKQKETQENVDEDPLMLIDASGLIYRAYFAMPPMHRQDGMPVGAVLGFCNMLNRIALNQLLNGEMQSKKKPPRVILVFDVKGKTFRHDMYSDYKANRPECPMDLVPQFDMIHEAAKAYGIPEIEAAGYEADDVIATLATNALEQGLNTHILSTDKDLMQLIKKESSESNYIHMMDPMSMVLTDSEAVAKKWNVSQPEMLGDLLALAGDSSDNIPGVPGIGPKTAALLLQQFDTLENIYQNVESITQKRRKELLIKHKDQAFLSRKLVELERCIPFEEMTGTVSTSNLEDVRMQTVDRDRLFEFYRKMGFKTLQRKVEDRLMVHQSRKRRVTRKEKTRVPKPEDYEDVPF
mmetsp:Transcript_34953/g.39846  ORF Transcript_34953/g.39846 Transcript_34953/m.39846 type:complete len:681 (+) Transcript_34953:55-2097(+)